jgi:hypothetical protein
MKDLFRRFPVHAIVVGKSRKPAQHIQCRKYFVDAVRGQVIILYVLDLIGALVAVHVLA